MSCGFSGTGYGGFLKADSHSYDYDHDHDYNHDHDYERVCSTAQQPTAFFAIHCELRMDL